jgi:hypothetical protein
MLKVPSKRSAYEKLPNGSYNQEGFFHRITSPTTDSGKGSSLLKNT